ncbi:MAG: CHAD domain-containing protein [Massilia sp.]
MHTEVAFQAIATCCLAHMAANGEGVVAGDGESVHQMRVGLRRFKSACRLFRKHVQMPADLSPELSPQLAAEVAWLGDVLGPARDWDVLANSTLPAIASHAPDQRSRSALASLQQRATETARRQCDAAAAAVASARFSDLIEALEDWTGQLAAGAGVVPVSVFARAALARDRKRLAKRARHLSHADPPARHRLRIAAKKSRYDAEFFLSLYNTRSQRRYLRRLAALQDVLGGLNDAAVASALLADLADLGDAPVMALGLGFVQGYLSAGQEEGVRKAGRLWRKLERA